jgi:hypothetical protein
MAAPSTEGEKRTLSMANPARRRTRWDIRSSTRQSGRGGRGTPDAWSARRALKPQQVWAIRFWLDRERRLRDRALFDLAIDSKLRGCDVVRIRIGEIVSGGRVRTRGHALTIDSAQSITSGEPINALPRGTAGITAFKAYTAESRHITQVYTLIAEAVVYEAVKTGRATQSRPRIRGTG